MTFEFHPEALLEYREAAAFYESRRSGLGGAFTIEVESTVQRIVEAPELWQTIEQGVRKCRTHTFPYAILYSNEQDLVLILAIMHLHRKPGYWRSRVHRAEP